MKDDCKQRAVACHRSVVALTGIGLKVSIDRTWRNVCCKMKELKIATEPTWLRRIFCFGAPMSSIQEEFLSNACLAAEAAGHIFPVFAACEAALESAWGKSTLATQANNLFGQKQRQPPLPGSNTISLPTREFLNGRWVTVDADWVCFADWSECFHARMQLLQSARDRHPHYAAALDAATGEEFVRMVSQTWSTDPSRASKVLSIYAAHHAYLASTKTIST